MHRYFAKALVLTMSAADLDEMSLDPRMSGERSDRLAALPRACEGSRAIHVRAVASAVTA